MTAGTMMKMLAKAHPSARVMIEATPGSNEWTGVKKIGILRHEPDDTNDLVDTKDRRIHKGSVLIETNQPPPVL